MANDHITFVGNAIRESDDDSMRTIIKGLRGFVTINAILKVDDREYLAETGIVSDSWGSKHFVLVGLKCVTSRPEDSLKIVDMNLSREIMPEHRERLSAYYKKKCLTRSMIYHGPSAG